MMTQTVWADVFRTARKELGLSQRAFAEASGIPRRTIEDWEREVNTPPCWVQKLVLGEMERMEEKTAEKSR